MEDVLVILLCLGVGVLIWAFLWYICIKMALQALKAVVDFLFK